MIASRPSTSATLAASASIGLGADQVADAVAPWPSSCSTQPSQSVRACVEQLALDLSMSSLSITIAGEASTSPAASEPMADSTRAAASSTGSSTW